MQMYLFILVLTSIGGKFRLWLLHTLESVYEVREFALFYFLEQYSFLKVRSPAFISASNMWKDERP